MDIILVKLLTFKAEIGLVFPPDNIPFKAVAVIHQCRQVPEQ